MRSLEEVKREIKKIKENNTLSPIEKSEKLLLLDEELDKLLDYELSNKVEFPMLKNKKSAIFSINYKEILC